MKSFILLEMSGKQSFNPVGPVKGSTIKRSENNPHGQRRSDERRERNKGSRTLVIKNG